MITKNEMGKSPAGASKKKDDKDDLEQFIQKKKNQNVALKKIIEKIHTDENHLANK